MLSVFADCYVLQNVVSDWEIEMFINDISKQLPNYENNNIYLGTNINLKKIGTYMDKPNLVSNITESDNLLVFSIKNNSSISSLGANNKEYFILGFQTNDETGNEYNKVGNISMIRTCHCEVLPMKRSSCLAEL